MHPHGVETAGLWQLHYSGGQDQGETVQAMDCQLRHMQRGNLTANVESNRNRLCICGMCPHQPVNLRGEQPQLLPYSHSYYHSSTKKQDMMK